MGRFITWAMPGIVFTVAFGFAACNDAAQPSGGCPPTTGSGAGGTGSSAAGTGGANVDGGTGGSAEQAPGGVNTSGDTNDTFDHFNDPGESGQKDPFEILKERALEGPPEVRTRLHSCSKIPYAVIGDFLASRGVDIQSKVAKSAGDIYQNGGDAMGIAHFDAREGEGYFHTTAGATKLFDVFVQAAPEIIKNIQSQADCQVAGVGKPMFDAKTGNCVPESLTCIMGRPATDDDLTLCNLMIAQATPGDLNDLTIKQNIAVAAFLSAAHSCE